MATSGSVNFSDTKDTLIKDSLLDLGAVADEDTVAAHTNAHASRVLNRLIKRFQTYGMPLWKMERVTVLTEKNKVKYLLGPTGDHVVLTDNVNETAMRVAAVTTDTTMEVDSTTGMTAGDYVGVVMDDGNIHWTTVASVTDSDTFELTVGLTAASAIDNAVYFYTTKANRPLLITHDAFVRDSSNNDRPVKVMSRNEYWQLGNKSSTSGSIVEIYYDLKLDNGVLYVYNPPSDVTESLELVCQMPIEDMDDANDNFDFPQEWLLPIQKYLSFMLFPAYGGSREDYLSLREQAMYELSEVIGWDSEKTSIYIAPAQR